ncbi:MAG: DUF4105 domain-containing protein [Spirochaetales bacterium]|nr:DUF4105 domain-containing protein [Leptospiraceae bacterium]MCP5482880.1 DUF4105 domain-containing protein [Spirochaetales bacterium]
MLAMRTMLPGAAILMLAGALMPIQAQANRSWPPPSLAPSATNRFRVDVINVAPGEPIYSSWGHTALRILDNREGFDYVFDYGVFRFDDDFVFRFLQGKPAYMLWVSSLQRTLFRYSGEQRTVYAQQIFMSDEMAEELLNRMIIDALPANREFLYDHFYDNCTTRVRDIVDQLLDQEPSARLSTQATGRSLRDESMDLLLDSPALWFGTNLIMGKLVDEPITAWQQMFLPLQLKDGLESFRAGSVAEGPVSIGPIQIIYDGQNLRTVRPAPWIFFAACLLMLIIAFAWPALRPSSQRAPLMHRLTRYSWHILSGLIGIILLLLWLATDHRSTHNNLNTLAFFPPSLIWPLFDLTRFGRDPKKAIFTQEFLLLPGCIGLALEFSGLWPQFSWPYLGLALVIQGLIVLGMRRMRAVENH